MLRAGILLGVLLAGCQATTPTPLSVQPSPASLEPTLGGLSTFTSEAWGFRLSYPHDWTVESGRSDRFLPPDDSFGFSVAHVHPVPEFSSEAGFEKNSRAQFAASGAELRSTTRYAVDGDDGLLSTYTFQVKGTDAIALDIAVYHSGIGYDILITALGGREQEQALRSVLDQIMRSFVWLE